MRALQEAMCSNAPEKHEGPEGAQGRGTLPGLRPGPSQGSPRPVCASCTGRGCLSCCLHVQLPIPAPTPLQSIPLLPGPLWARLPAQDSLLSASLACFCPITDLIFPPACPPVDAPPTRPWPIHVSPPWAAAGPGKGASDVTPQCTCSATDPRMAGP